MTSLGNWACKLFSMVIITSRSTMAKMRSSVWVSCLGVLGTAGFGINSGRLFYDPSSGIEIFRPIEEVESGLIDAALGGFLYKMRSPQPDSGKSRDYRTLLSAPIGGAVATLIALFNLEAARHALAKMPSANLQIEASQRIDSRQPFILLLTTR